jgi:apolipoprotein N-acyltransferase
LDKIMGRLAGSIILLSGWKRTLVAMLAGAVAVLGQAPYDFPAACFVAFPILVWLLDGSAAAMRPGLGAAEAVIPYRLLVRLRLFPCRPLVDWRSGSCRSRRLRLGVALCRVGHTVGSGGLLRDRLRYLAAGVERRSRPYFRAGLRLRRRRMAEKLVLTGFPWNSIGYAAMPVPVLMQSVEMVGLLGMNMLAVFVFAAPALLVSARGATVGMMLAAAIAALHIGMAITACPCRPPT